MDEKELDKFDPTVADLQKMVEVTKNIKATDLEDSKQLAIVKDNRITLKKARVQIEKTGKALRENALKFQKAVIAKEKELVAIIEPEENRLASIEEEAEKLVIRKERLEKLPVRKERIIKAGLEFFATKSDEDLLELDANGFETYFNELGATKVQYDADQERIKREEAEKLLTAENAKKKAEQDAKEAELATREKKLEDDRRQLEHEKEVKAAEERAKIETEARLKREAEEKATAERVAAEKVEADKKAKQLALEKKEAYAKFLKSHGWTRETAGDFKTEETAEGYALYKKLGVFKR